jgi:hypothetical protein
MPQASAQQGTLGQQAAAAGVTLVPGQNVTQADMNALMGGIKDVVTGYYYSTVKLAAGTALASFYNFFNAGLGQPDPYPLSTITGAAPILTKVETNVIVASNFGLTPPYDIIIDSLGLYVHPFTIKQDLDTLTLYSYFEFTILGKVQWDGKLEFYPPGQGYSGFSTQTTESGWQNGISDPNAKKRFGEYGKYLSPNLTFAWPLYFPPTSGPVGGIFPPVYAASSGVPSQASLTAGNATPTPGNGTQLRAIMSGILGRPVT